MTIANNVATAGFRPVGPAEINRLRAPVQRLLSFEGGQLIYRQGEQASSIYRVNEGAVRVYRILPDGRRYILAFHCPGDWFGLQANGRHDDFAEAICESNLARFPVVDPAALPVSLLSLAMENLATARERQLALVCQSAIGRVAWFVLDMAEHFGGSDYELFMSRRDVADYLGLAVESVARSFTKLADLHIIQMEGRSHRLIRILSREKLKALID
ncbi:helix-turn-helix domain-containing protein [Rhizobium sp. S152]|uniref:cyclic nucleotide-binding domain-containing protein n=1 Tax=Rhizobium sp. S152 TaxID=3055038 RepID=UPI0025A96D6B|nr:cyclic nucleotide-binding domain-containing protein [Rhizobium sp. S152]MDM9628130.1 helix-turn-helix domain-containing protein [Rhizobium sp. S152]